eukprot:7658303-Pyramimonas_sp.AAC.1
MEAAASGAGGGLRRRSNPAEIWRPRRAAIVQASTDPLRATEAALGGWKQMRRVGDLVQQAPR